MLALRAMLAGLAGVALLAGLLDNPRKHEKSVFLRESGAVSLANSCYRTVIKIVALLMSNQLGY